MVYLYIKSRHTNAENKIFTSSHENEPKWLPLHVWKGQQSDVKLQGMQRVRWMTRQRNSAVNDGQCNSTSPRKKTTISQHAPCHSWIR